MFEKEAEEYTGKVHRYKDNLKESLQDEDVLIAYKDGAEFGYNKANEWHYVKDGAFPEEGEIVLCCSRGYCGVPSFATARLYIGYDDKVRRWWTNAGAGKSEQLIDVIAWEKIVLPELKEIEKDVE